MNRTTVPTFREARVDVREGGRWTAAQRVKNDVLYVAVTVALAVATRLPTSVLRASGIALGALAWLIVPSARRIATANVARAFPGVDARARAALARRAYVTLGRELGNAVAMLDGRRAVDPLPFAPGARETLEDALSEGRGVVFASAHLGPWEHVAATLASAGMPLTAVAREAYDPRLTRIYERLRGARGVKVIWRSAAGAATALLRTLRSGGMLGVPMDLASRVPSIDVPFLGVPAPTPVGPARLALRTGAAVVVGTIAEGRMISTTRIDTTGLDEGALTAKINEELSRRIRALPEAWVWMHRRWP